MKDLKVIFMGTPLFAVPVLEYLIKNTNLVLVITKKDTYEGRKRVLTYSPVKKCALENNIGKIVPECILSIPKLGCINIHASLLPKYRGASPIQSAILNGETKTGVTIMYMDKGMDTGNIISMESINIDDNDNLETLSNKLSILGAKLLEKTLPLIVKRENESIPQNDEEATYVGLITREDEKINFNKDGKDIINQIRAFAPSPYANFILNDKEIKVCKASFIKKNSEVGKVYASKNNLEIGCKDGVISLEIVKPMGKNEMNIKAFLNGIDKENLYVNN